MSGTNLDPSISLRAGQGVAPIANPLATFGQFTGIQNALTQNRAMEAGIKQTEQSTAGMAQDQALKRLGIAQQAAGALLLEHPDGVPASALTSTVAQLLGMGIFKREEIAPMLQSVPMGDSPEETAARTEWAKRFNVQALGIMEQVARSRGGMPQFLNTGGENVPFVASEREVRMLPGAVPNTLDPGTATAPTNIPQPGGGVKTYTRAGVAQMGGMGNLVAPGVFGADGGRLPPALRNPNNGKPPVIGESPDTATGAAQQATGTSSAANFDTIAKAGTEAKGRDALIATMAADAAKFLPGPGAEGVKALKAAISTAAQRIGLGDLGIDQEKIGGQEAFNKFVNMLSNAQGAGSDARMAVLTAANPSSTTTEAGLRQIFAALRGNEQYNLARATLAQKWTNKADHQGFEAYVRQNLDPRAFQLSAMPQDQRVAFFKGFKDQRDRDAIKRSFDWAKQQGLINAGL